MWQLLKNVAYTSCAHTHTYIHKIVDSRRQLGTLPRQMWFLILQFLTFAFAFILDFTRPNLKHAYSHHPPTNYPLPPSGSSFLRRSGGALPGQWRLTNRTGRAATRCRRDKWDLVQTFRLTCVCVGLCMLEHTFYTRSHASHAPRILAMSRGGAKEGGLVTQVR